MMPRTTDSSSSGSFYRFPVASDCSSATLKIGRHRIDVVVQETSIDGFTVLVPAHAAHQLKISVPWILNHQGARYETFAQWFYHTPEGHSQIGLRRLRDLTPVPTIGHWYTGLVPFRSKRDGSDSTVACAGFVLVLFLVMAMPGLGEKLGTADRIQNAVRYIYSGVGKELGLW